ncbi:MAG TPA: alkaline phosphatase family protein [Bacteroidales bacterium]
MMRTTKFLCFILFFVLCLPVVMAQKPLQTQNVILVTYDGLRWQEVFSGADKTLINDTKFVSDTSHLNSMFWKDNSNERRNILMPFLWSTVARQGQIYGNRKYQNKVNTTNMFWFSYPGYNEILTGIRNDKAIFTNRKTPNPNVTVLEYLNSLPSYHNRVAVFGSWDVFPYILNRKRSGLFINAGYEPIRHEHLSSQEMLLNSQQNQSLSPWPSVRPDAFTFHFAIEYLKQFAPRVLEISFGETDDIAHDGKYDGYLEAINRTDRFIEELWNYLQSDDNYRNKTTLIITTDHGRGHLFRNSWKKHGRGTPGSGQTWFAVLGPDTEPLGEIKTAGQLYQNQLARTLATFLNVDFNLYVNSGNAITQVIGKKTPKETNMVGMLTK